MIFVSIYAASLPYLHHIAGECENVVGFIPQRPIVELDRRGVIVVNLHVFIGLLAARAIVEDGDDTNIPGGMYLGGRWRACCRGRWSVSRYRCQYSPESLPPVFGQSSPPVFGKSLPPIFTQTLPPFDRLQVGWRAPESIRQPQSIGSCS